MGRQEGAQGRRSRGEPTQVVAVAPLPQVVPDQRGGAEEGDDLQGGRQAEDNAAMLRTAGVLVKHLD